MTGYVWWLLTLPCVLLALLLIGSPDFPALNRALNTAFASSHPAGSSPVSQSPLAEADLQAPTQPVELVEVNRPRPSDSRGAIVPLYVSFAALQALDIHSTMTALNRSGVREGNPMMAGVVDKPVAFVALKAATGAGIIYLTERVRKHSRTGALVMMAAFNSLYATVVAHNYRVATR